MGKTGRVRIAGLSLAIVLAGSAMAAASASASPLLLTYKQCVKVEKTEVGEYTSAECSLASKGEGKYDLREVTDKSFTTKGKTSTFYAYIPANESEPWAGGSVADKVTCKTVAGSGEIVSEMRSVSTVEYKTCTTEGKKCTSERLPSGTVVMHLDTEPVLLEGKSLLLSYATAARTSEGESQGEVLTAAQTTPSAEFDCEGIEIHLENATLGTATGNIQTAVKASHDVYGVNEKTGEQEDVFFEGETGRTVAYQLSYFQPPGVVIGWRANTNQELKTKDGVGIYPT